MKWLLVLYHDRPAPAWIRGGFSARKSRNSVDGPSQFNLIVWKAENDCTPLGWMKKFTNWPAAWPEWGSHDEESALDIRDGDLCGSCCAALLWPADGPGPCAGDGDGRDSLGHTGTRTAALQRLLSEPRLTRAPALNSIQRFDMASARSRSSSAARMLGLA
jgi:hypothetical protein